jgi:hypothetical protein
MSIRTTVVLDEDVLERLKEEARSRGVPFRQALNDVLRSSLLATRQSSQAHFRIEPKHMGTRPGLNYDSVAALLEFGEGDNYR